jgi:carboxyl-terminal processing protease
VRIRRSVSLALALAALSLITSLAPAQQPPMSSFDRDRAQGILRVIAGDVQKHYYDPKFHGLDWDAKVGEAKEGIAKADTFNRAMSSIAAVLDTLNDSHTFFLPPQHEFRLSYGFEYQMVGDRCFVTRVRPKSDAEGKGVKPGDELVALNGFNVNRDDLWKMQYVFSVLRPQPALRLALRDEAGAQRQVDIAAKIRQHKRITDLTFSGAGQDIFDLIRESETEEHLMRARFAEYGDQLIALKVPEFLFSRDEVENMIGKARKYPNLIIDLRGNPGGSVETLKYLVGGVFDKDVKIGDRVGRKEAKPEVAKGWHNSYSGKIVVLVDARSASAAELFARLIQLEKRGAVIGDQSSGSVMEAKQYTEQMGSDTVIFYGASITEWDLLMSDGKSLEQRGVTPDEIVLPGAHDIAIGRDPALAYAAQTLGVKITPEAAGKAFPYEWPPE